MAALRPLIETTELPTSLPGTPQYTQQVGDTNTMCAVGGLRISNTSSGTRTFTIHHVTYGGATATTNKIFDAITIAGKTTYEIGYGPSEWPLAGGDEIYAFADGSGVNLSMSGEEIA